jgi:hypothetical protein
MRILGVSASRENAKTLFVAGVSATPRGHPGLLQRSKHWLYKSTALCDRVYGAVSESEYRHVTCRPVEKLPHTFLLPKTFQMTEENRCLVSCVPSSAAQCDMLFAMPLHSNET